MVKVLISDLTKLGPIDVPSDVELVTVSESAPIPEEHRDAEACVIWGYDPELENWLNDLGNLCWIQTFLAGPDKLLALDLPGRVIITNGLHFHDRTVAEHALTLTLSLLRRIPDCLERQRDHVWDDSLGGIQQLHPENRVTTLIDTNVTIWGFGAIGQQIAKLLQPFGARVRGIARSAGERTGIEVFTEDDLPQVLSDTEILIMVLPQTPATHQVLNEQVIASLPEKAVVVNVGRGTTVDEAALVAALQNGKLGGAGLDVTYTEPLPQDSPLWEAPNVIITPHAAGGRPVGAEERIAHNVRAWLAGEEMIGVVKAGQD